MSDVTRTKFCCPAISTKFIINGRKTQPLVWEVVCTTIKLRYNIHCVFRSYGDRQFVGNISLRNTPRNFPNRN